LLSLTLDEEVQLRCASFVQAEIEVFTEEVAVRSETAGGDGSEDGGVSGDDDATPKKGGGRKGKKPANGTKETTTTNAGKLFSEHLVWTWRDHVMRRETNHTGAARARICFHGRNFDVFEGDSCWSYLPDA
jgi:hypothetical protein